MYGSKADTLFLLLKKQIKIPPFYVVPSRTLQRLAEHEQCEKLIHEFEAWKNHIGVTSVAVRSSSDEEDSLTQSFAGQLVSILNVSTPEDFMKALRDVAAAVPAKAYSEKKVTIHAIVQAFIEPESAGVCFSVQPATGTSNLLINAVSGRGKKAVEGEAVDTYLIDRTTKRAITHSGSTNPLSKSDCKAIAETVLQVEQILMYPADIEWAIKDHTLWILQARPITKIAFLQVWDSSNISESFPGIISPLTFSIARKGYGLVYRSQANKAGMDWLSLEKEGRMFDSMLGIFKGRVYYNLLQWYRFIGLFPGNSRNQAYLDSQIQTMGEAVYLPPIQHDFWYSLKFYFMLIRRVLTFEGEQKRYRALLSDLFAAFDHLPPGTNPFLLLEKYLFLEKKVLPIMGSAVDNDFFVMTYNGLLQSLLKNQRIEGDVTQFLGQMKDVISANQAVLLYEIALEIQKDTKALKLLQDKDYNVLTEYLQKSRTVQLICEYKGTFGYRFAEEQKIEVPNPLLTDEGFYQLIATYTMMDTKVLAKRVSATRTSETKQEQHILNQLSFPHKAVFTLLQNRLKHHLRLREKNRLLRSKVFAYCRGIFHAMGEGLKNGGILRDASDIYFLEVDEIYRFMNGMLPEGNLLEIIANRKRKYREYEKESPPRRFITTSYPYRDIETIRSAKQTSDENKTTALSGTISSPGDVSGVVVVLTHPVIPSTPFDVLVTTHTDPGWTPLIALAKGVIVEHGGILSHAAIITRELGIPSIIGVENASTLLKTGMKVRINTAKSSVEIL